jgi:hypothetical protein
MTKMPSLTPVFYTSLFIEKNVKVRSDAEYKEMTNSTLVYEPNAGAGSQPMSTAVHIEPK